MKIGSDCSNCEECITHYTGGCIAGHGDDHFYQVTKEDVLAFISKVKTIDKYHQQLITDKFPSIFTEYMSKLTSTGGKIGTENPIDYTDDRLGRESYLPEDPFKYSTTRLSNNINKLMDEYNKHTNCSGPGPSAPTKVTDSKNVAEFMYKGDFINVVQLIGCIAIESRNQLNTFIKLDESSAAELYTFLKDYLCL